MPTDPRETAPEIAQLLHLAGVVRQVVALNAAGVSHEESLIQPRPGGNCMNWVLGHLVAVYDRSREIFRPEGYAPDDSLARYPRGSEPITGPEDARDFGELLALWDDLAKQHEAGLAALTRGDLSKPAPFSPDGPPREGDTVGSLLATIQFHQAYHAGQLGVLRRIAGKEGAIS
jgi:hypothetical protein